MDLTIRFSSSKWKRPSTHLMKEFRAIILFAVCLAASTEGFSQKSNTEKSTSSQKVNNKVEVIGVVKDETGKPLQGASISVKGNSKGTATNERGEFNISVPNESSVLLISYVGMQAQEVSVKGKTEFTINLKAGDSQQQELVVVGYGKQSRSKLTSSVSTIKTDQFKDAPYTNIQAALQGRVAGVIVNAAGGEPGSVPSLTIRGGEPLIGQSAPLYVIDGIIRDQNALLRLM
jgi:hypothetical protein